jgi:hypothetical protein
MSMSSLVGRRIFGAVLALVVAACNNPGGATSTTNPGVSGGDVGSSGGGWSKASPEAAPHVGFASFTPQSVQGGGSGGVGGGGGGSQLLSAPYGVSDHCGDAIVGTNEECDDGDEGSDACTATCYTRDQPAVPVALGPAVDRYLGAGRHPNAGSTGGFITTYVEQAEAEPNIGATLFNIWGQVAHHVDVSDGASPIDEANPVAAALSGGSYAVAWSDFDGDGSDLGVALRLVHADGSLGSLHAANASAEFSQLNPDMVWTGNQLVVAWEDYADAANGPDIRYRTFDADLNPTSSDLTLANSSLPEAAVALATSNGAWAAAYREGAIDGKENIVVKVGANTFRIGPVYGGPLDDRPALVALDATHWLVAFSVGTDPASTGIYNASRVRYAIVDTAAGASSTPASSPLDPLDDVYTYDQLVSQLSPSAEVGNGGVYLAWRTKARPGDAGGDQLWLKQLRWGPRATGGPSVLEPRDAESLLPRTCEGSIGDQRRPALANVPLPPNNALAIAWDDFSHAQGQGDPDVVVHYAPLSPADTTSPQLLTETWTLASGNAWPARWTVSTSGANASYSVLNNKGVFSQGTGIDGYGEAYVNDHTALNIDVVTSLYFFSSVSNAGIFVRRNEAATSWLGAQVAITTNDRWRIYSVINGTATDLAFMPMPLNFTLAGAGYEYWLRFRATTAADGSVFLGMKFWRTGGAEPAAWLLQSTQPAGSAVANAFGSQAGRFGIRAGLNTTNRKVKFDDFRAVFFEGNQLGDPTQAPRDGAPLKRSAADYRACRPGHVCGKGEGCCFSNADCNTALGLSCASGQGEFQHLGSHANTCVPDHCHNLKLDADEFRADCGGADCAPCTCTVAAAPNTGQNCTDGCLCGIGEGECEYNECLPGLTCGVDNGRQFGLAAGIEACAPPHCFDRILDGGESAKDCGGDCGTNCSCEPQNGVFFHCRVFCPCALGHGDCWFDDECATGLVCGSGKGPKYGLPTGTRACTPPHCVNNVFEAALGEITKDCGGECGSPCP